MNANDLDTCLDDRLAEIVGAALATELKLKPLRGYMPVRYDLENGNKNRKGLARTVVRLILDTLHTEGVKLNDDCECEKALRAIIKARDCSALADDPAYYQIDEAINAARKITGGAS